MDPIEIDILLIENTITGLCTNTFSKSTYQMIKLQITFTDSPALFHHNVKGLPIYLIFCLFANMQNSLRI